MQSAPIPKVTLAEFYRLALLLTGNIKTAEQIMADTLRDVREQLGELRHEASRQAWLASRIRQRCLRENAGGGQPVRRLLRADEDDGLLPIEAFIVAQQVSTLPEPERSALALFYTELFSADEIGKILKVNIEELAGLLSRARALLADAMQTST